MQREREKSVQLAWHAGGKIRIPGEPWHHAAPVGVEGSLKRAYEDPRTLLRSGAERADLQPEMLAETASVLARPVVAADTGCRDGTATAVAMARCERTAGAQVSLIGLDWSRAALEEARRRGVREVRASISRSGLLLASGSVEVVIMSELIEHLVDTDAALDEAARVLVPGGRLLLSTPNLAAWYNRVLLAVGVQPAYTEVSLCGIFGRRATRWSVICASSPTEPSSSCWSPRDSSTSRSRGPLITTCRGRCARSTACFVAHRAVRRSFSRPLGGCRER